MKRIVPILLIVALLLTGCSGLLDSSYHSVTRHEVQNSQTGDDNISVRSYSELCSTLIALIGEGRSNSIITVSQYDQSKVEPDTQQAIAEVMATDPIAAYAVEHIEYELGTNAGQQAIAVSITYLHSRTEILRIRHYSNQSLVDGALADALNACDAGIVMYIENYQDMDFDLWVSAYSAAHPEKVMEVPEVVATVYPEAGAARVVELKFSYENSRDVLRAMQTNVKALFDEAMAYAGTDGTQAERFEKLYTFLIGQNPDFELETSITPAYSLLIHGVGDSKAVAQIYAAMCTRAGLECITVTGTRAGEPWYWNFVSCDGAYYHVDLLACRQTEAFAFRLDEDMSGYVWDYSAYTTQIAESAT